MENPQFRTISLGPRVWERSLLLRTLAPSSGHNGQQQQERVIPSRKGLQPKKGKVNCANQEAWTLLWGLVPEPKPMLRQSTAGSAGGRVCTAPQRPLEISLAQNLNVYEGSFHPQGFGNQCFKYYLGAGN